jgi:hypothetical protein
MKRVPTIQISLSNTQSKNIQIKLEKIKGVYLKSNQRLRNQQH